MSASDRSSALSPKGPIKLFSCVLCKQRKVKCDKNDPCTNCSRTGAPCLYRAPPPPRRRKKNAPPVDVQARLRQCEDLLQSLGVKIDSLPVAETAPGEFCANEAYLPPSKEAITSDPTDPASDAGILIAEGGKTRYLNNQLWNSISNELHDPAAVLDESDEDDVSQAPGTGIDSNASAFFFQQSSQCNPQEMHPHSVFVPRLLQAYQDNVDPITKLVHFPTLSSAIRNAATNIETIPKPLTALIFAVYSCAILSMTAAECESNFGETRPILLRRYQSATRAALINAKFLKTSDLLVYQAFILYMMSMRPVEDPVVLWNMLGVAQRIGIFLGLHKDGEPLGLSVFESEMRRRLWWHIQVFDSHMSTMIGVGPIAPPQFNIKTPLNLNDDDLFPAMTQLPPERAGATDLIFCKMRYEIGNFMLRIKLLSDDPGATSELQALAEKEKQLDELEHRLENEYLRFCDPVIPIHMMASTLLRGAVCRLRFILHHPKQYKSLNTSSMSGSERELLFQSSVKMMTYDNQVHSTKVLQRFLWHVTTVFQWHAFLFLLNELCVRIEGSEIENAWKQVEEVFGFHHLLLTDQKQPLCKAVGNLTLKAWTAREEKAVEKYGRDASIRRPKFISDLFEQRERKRSTSKETPSSDAEVAAEKTPFEVVQDFRMDLDPNKVDVMESSPLPVNWAEWDNLLRDYDEMQYLLQFPNPVAEELY